MTDVNIRQLTPSENDRVANFVAGVLVGKASESYSTLYKRYADQLPTRPSTIDRLYRGVLSHQGIISLIHTYDFTLRYGRASLNVVAISTLCTQAPFRNQGYASALLRDTLTYSAEQGAHLVLINSPLEGYFQRFGFSPVWATYTLQAPTEKAIRLKQSYQLRVATPADLPMMQKLYNHYWGLRVTAERSMASWRWRMQHARGEALVIIDKKHRIKGYIWHLADDFSGRNEVIATTPDAIATALAYSGRRWQAGGYPHLNWSVPPDDVIIPYAQQMLPITLTASFNPTGGWMARVIDLGALLSELLPEIVAQAHATYPQFEADALSISSIPDGIDIRMQNNPIAHARLSLRDFMQLVFGSLRPESLAVRQQYSSETLHLLRMLFPPRIASIAPWDWI